MKTTARLLIAIMATAVFICMIVGMLILDKTQQDSKQLIQQAHRRIAVLEAYVEHTESRHAPCDLTTFEFEEVE